MAGLPSSQFTLRFRPNGGERFRSG